VLARFEGGYGVGLVEFIGGEVEDYVDVGAGEDVGWVGGGEGDVEFGGAVVGILRDISTCYQIWVGIVMLLPFLRYRRLLW
jgi:hypothetical protein